MNIILEKKDNIKTFADVKFGEAFCFNEEIYMKVACSEYNAVKMSCGLVTEFSDCVEIQGVESELKIKLL